MLDSLKRHCERLAAGHLDCENVVDTCAYAKVSICREHERGVELNTSRRRMFLDTSVREKMIIKKKWWENVWHRFVQFQSCDAKELLTYCEGFILKNLPAMMDIKNFRDTLFNNNSKDVSTRRSSTSFPRMEWLGGKFREYVVPVRLGTTQPHWGMVHKQQPFQSFQ